MLKKLISVILCISVMSGCISGLNLSVSATETEERDVHYSDLFYGYFHYLENSPILKQYYEGTSGTLGRIYTDFYNDGEYAWSAVKTFVDLTGSPAQAIAIIAEKMGFSHYTYNNMLDSANVIFVKHLANSSAGSELAPTFNKYYTAFKDATNVIGDISHELAEIPESSDNYATSVVDAVINAFKEEKLLLRIPDAELMETSQKLINGMGEIVSAAGEITSVIDAATVYATALSLENARIDVVYDIYSTAPQGSMLRNGMNRLYNDLTNEFSTYFVENYIVDKVLVDFADELLGKIGGGAVGIVSGVAKVLSFVSFEILRPETVSLDDLMTQVALKSYVDDAYRGLTAQNSVFSAPFKSEQAITYLNALQGLVCAVDAACDATEKIVLDYNKAELETIKRNFYGKDMRAVILNQAVETIKTTPKDELVKKSYGDWVLTLNVSSYNSTLCGSSDKIELYSIYTPWDGLNANFIIPVDFTVTVPESECPLINGYLKCSKNRSRGGAVINNYGDLTVNGYFAAESSSNANAMMFNYGVFRVSGNIGLGYNGSYTAYDGSVTYAGNEISIGCRFEKGSTLYYGRDLIVEGNWSTSYYGHIILTGTNKQTLQLVNWPKITIENTSSEGVELYKVNVNEYFNHNGKTFTANNCTFVDYDGDGVKDNADTSPLVGKPCVITVTTNGSEKGFTSANTIETCGGTEHTVTATPTEKYEFVKWINASGTSVSTKAEYSFVAKTDDTLTAVFKKRSQPISVNVSGGTISAPTSAEIESEVSVSITENEGYVYTEGSLKCNETPIENGRFIMPDEAVTLTAEFIRNQNYFALKEKLNEAKKYTFQDYSAESFANLQNIITNAENVLTHNVSEEIANEHISALQNAESALTDKYIVEIWAEAIPELYIDVEDLIYNSTVVIYYDNSTYDYTSAFTVENFDCNTLGEQEVIFKYGEFLYPTTVTVQKRQIVHTEADNIPDQLVINSNTYLEPELSLSYLYTNDNLVLNEDYTVSYSNNNAVGTATVTVTGKGIYEGSKDLHFAIYCDHPLEYDNNGMCGKCGYYILPQTDENGTYLISNAGNLFAFAQLVNSGNTAINGKLLCDLDVSDYSFVKIGTEACPYKGTFDGNYHTLEFIINDSLHSAPFAWVDGCTIKNLHTKGTIYASDKYASGIIGEMTTAATTVSNCVSGVNIYSTVSGDGTHGGIVAVAWNSTVTNCGFYGSINGSSTDSCGGLIGWSHYTSTIKNCYVAASYTINSYNGNTFVRSGNSQSLSNCYYLNTLYSNRSGSVQKTAEQFANGEVCDLLNNGSKVWSQKVGTDLYPLICGHLNVENGICLECGAYEEPVKNSNGYYELSNVGNLFWFSETVNGGNNTINAILTADIDLGGLLWIPIGVHDDFDRTVASINFKGKFDGNYHIIKNMTVIEENTKEAGFFGRTNGAYICNLGIENASVTQSNNNKVRAGILGGEIYNSKVENCYALGTVSTLHETQFGGIAGEAAGGTTITNCYTNFPLLSGNAGTLTNCFDSTTTTPEQFASGEICTLLNNGNKIWKQTIGKDLYPTFSGGTVFGDLDGDCLINALDLIRLRKAIMTENEDFTSNPSADANNDSKIDIRDLVYLKNQFLQVL